MEKNISRQISYFWVIAPIFLIISIFVTGYKDTKDICLLFLSSIFIVLFNKKTITLTILDISILILWGYEIILLFTSINRIGSFFYIKTFTVTVLYYFILRIIYTKKRIKVLLFWESLFFSILAFIGIISFLLFGKRIHSGGFNDLYDFRYIFFPLGNLTNAWTNLLVGFLGTICLSIIYATRKQKIILFLLTVFIVFGLIVSFSRGAYLVMFFLILLSAFLLIVSKNISRTKKVGIASVFLIIFLSLNIPYFAEVERTLQINKSVSQQRSIEGRLNEGSVAYEIFKQYPITGVGNNNYSLAANEYLYENDPSTYTAIVSNAIFQISTEKGILGICLWITIFGIILYMIVPNIRKKVVIVIFLFAIALFLKELTFSVLLNHVGLQLIVVTWLVILQNNIIIKKNIFNINPVIFKTLRWSPLVIWGIIFTNDGFILYNKKYNEKCIQAVELNNIDSAEMFINRTCKTIPYLINRSSVYCKQYQQTGHRYYLDLAEETLKTAIAENPKDFQLQYNLALIFSFNGKNDEASVILNRLTSRFYKNPLYNVSLSILHSKNENFTEATKYLSQAIQLSPGILETSLFSEIINKYKNLDSMLYNELKKNMQTNRPENDNPIILAKQARIMLYLGDTVKSRSCFEKAVKQMPNLPRPWCYLGIIAFNEGDELNGKKYLTRSIAADPTDNLSKFYRAKYTKEEISPSVQKQKTNLNREYYLKFQKWYHTYPVNFDNLIFLLI